MPSTMAITDPDDLAVATIRTLAMDAVQAANSGHPGTPIALAPVAYTLWQEFLRFDPEQPDLGQPRPVRAVRRARLDAALLAAAPDRCQGREPRRTRLSASRRSPWRTSRASGSWTPSAPATPSTGGPPAWSATTGPLGTGFATSVGMAMASKWQAATFNRPGFELFDFDVYAIGGDGCMMEGVAQEAASLAGHLQLDNLCWIYDNNEITIEGSTSLAFSDDIATKFIGLGWNVTRVGDANDRRMLARAFATFKVEANRPTLIIVDSRIGYGAPDQGGHPRRARRAAGRRGDPRGQAVLRLARGRDVPGARRGVRALRCRDRCARQRAARGVGDPVRRLPPSITRSWPTELDRMQQRTLPDGWDADIPTFPADPKGLAGREANGKVLNAVGARVPWLVGGSADLAPSTKTLMTFEGAGDFRPGEPGGTQPALRGARARCRLHRQRPVRCPRCGRTRPAS